MTYAVHKIPSPHFSNRMGWDIKGVVMHYTAGGDALGSARWFADPQSRVSAHYIIGRHGTVYGCVDEKMAAWHSGRAEMVIDGESLSDMRSSCNSFTIGIELANRGPLVRSGKHFRYEFGGSLRTYRGPDPVEAVLIYDNGTEIEAWWEPFPGAQMDALQEVLLGIATRHGPDTARNIIGHEEIAMPFATRKRDPGPVFDWDRLSRKLPRRTSCRLLT